MRVCSISLDGFRNYTQFSAQFSPGVNVIWGENAQGKTNLLEAIGFLAGARSHRARGDKELIAFQRTQGTITAQVESRGRDFLIQALDADGPVAFLNFSNGSLPNLDSWHWVPLIALTEGEGVLLCTILDEGAEKVIDLALWQETTLLGGALVSLFPDPAL